MAIAPTTYTKTDLEYVALGASVLGSGGGGSYQDALVILADDNFPADFSVTVQPYDGESQSAVLAFIGSPDAGSVLDYTTLSNGVINTLKEYQVALGGALVNCIAPVEIGPLNSLVALIAPYVFQAHNSLNALNYVVDGDGAGRAVPELTEVTYAGAASLRVSPCVLANTSDPSGSEVQSATLRAATVADMENLSRGVVSGSFGSFAGIAMWFGFAGDLTGNYVEGTTGQAWQLGYYLSNNAYPTTASVVAQIASITGRETEAVIVDAAITSVTSATSGGFDFGEVVLTGSDGTIYTLYNLNESLIIYTDASDEPLIVAPDSICYYSETTGQGFSNATDDITPYLNSGAYVSVIRVAALPQLYNTDGVLDAFAEDLSGIGYAGALPYTASELASCGRSRRTSTRHSKFLELTKLRWTQARVGRTKA